MYEGYCQWPPAVIPDYIKVMYIIIDYSQFSALKSMITSLVVTFIMPHMFLFNYVVSLQDFNILIYYAIHFYLLKQTHNRKLMQLSSEPCANQLTSTGFVALQYENVVGVGWVTIQF